MDNHQSSKLRGLWLESRHSISALHTDRNQTFSFLFYHIHLDRDVIFWDLLLSRVER